MVLELLRIYLCEMCYRSFGEGNEERENTSPNVDGNIDSCYELNKVSSTAAQSHLLIVNEPSTSNEVTESTSSSCDTVSTKN